MENKAIIKINYKLKLKHDITFDYICDEFDNKMISTSNYRDLAKCFDINNDKLFSDLIGFIVTFVDEN